jgi:hypothetical protein
LGGGFLECSAAVSNKTLDVKHDLFSSMRHGEKVLSSIRRNATHICAAYWSMAYSNPTK